MPWESGGRVDDHDARVREQGSRVEGLWGGDGAPDGPGHGHIVTNDGLNASYVREPGQRDPIVDDRLRDPYSGHDRS